MPILQSDLTVTATLDTTHLGAPEKRPAPPDSMAAHLDRAARVFNQSVAVLAGKTEAHGKIIAGARDDILTIANAQHLDLIRELAKAYNRSEEQFHLQRSGIETLLAVHHATQEMIERRWRHTLYATFLAILAIALILGFVRLGHAQENGSTVATATAGERTCRIIKPAV